jgi:glucose/arabinose dehydrogenase
VSRVRIIAFLVICFGLLAGVAAQTSIAQDVPISPSVGEAAVPGDAVLPGDPDINAVLVATGFRDPVNMANAGDGSGRLFVVERPGFISIVTPEGEVLPEPFLSVPNLVKIDFLEQGLLGLAFHPDYANNGRFFVYYSSYSDNGALTLAEFKVSAEDPNLADPTSIRVLFQIADPFINHNGGSIHFGPDGYLYVAIGDGGAAGDPYDNAQDLSNFFGKILRLDVDNGDPYAIPSDNPFALAGRAIIGQARGEPAFYRPDGSPEIFVYGLRNPWQFSFDSQTGDMYISDVGQGWWEEINHVPAGTSGQNFGWDHLEGTHCYPATATECNPFGTLPVAEYSHADGSCSITGIGVARTEGLMSLDGVYITSDWCTGKIWGVGMDESGGWVIQELLDTTLLITGAGSGEDGALYFTSATAAFGRDYNPHENPTGNLWMIVETSSLDGSEELAPAEPAAEATPEA